MKSPGFLWEVAGNLEFEEFESISKALNKSRQNA
jgi:hypothetical protein